MRVYLVPCLGYTCANNLEREVRGGSDSGVEAEGWDRWPSRSGAGCCHLPRHLLPLPDRHHRSPPSERVAGAPGPGFTQSRGLVGPLCFPPWGPGHASSACGRVPWPAAGLTCISCREWPPRWVLWDSSPNLSLSSALLVPAGVLRGVLPWHWGCGPERHASHLKPTFIDSCDPVAFRPSL